jgi:hypothetical protein
MAVTVTKPRFSLSLGGDWQEMQSPDPEVTMFNSQNHRANLVVSAMGLTATLADTGQIAERLINLRMDSEKQVAAETGIDMTIAKPRIVQQPWGHATAYYGVDANGRMFNFSGMVTPKQSIGVYVESNKLSEESLRELLEQVLVKLRFDLGA